MRTDLIALLTLSLLAGCASTGGSEQPGAAVEEHGAKPIQEAPKVATVKPQEPQGSVLAELKDPNSILSKRSIYFDFDQFVIKDEFKPLVEAHAKFLVGHPKYKMLIQGNADERGSREYNLALGQKRAEAAKNMLKLQGAKEDQVEAVSLGKEKPRCTESNEDCWSQNRRDDMLYSGEY